jgi:DNA-binding transcriptional LysR family regulator
VPYVGVPRVGFRHELDAIFAARSVTRRVLVETRTMTAAASLVAHGMGATVVDPLCLVNFAPDALLWRPFHPKIEVEVGVIWSSTRPLSQVAQRFLRHSGWREEDHVL